MMLPCTINWQIVEEPLSNYISKLREIMNFKAFILLGLLFAVVLVSSTVTADQTPKDENKDVVNEAAKETNPELVDGAKPGSGGYCGGCCWIHGYRYCGGQCCWPEQEESKVVDDAAAYEANPDGYGGGWGGGGRGWGGGGRGWGGGGRGWGGGGRGWGGGGRGWGGGGRGWGGGGRGWGGGGRGWGGGWGGGGWRDGGGN